MKKNFLITLIITCSIGLFTSCEKDLAHVNTYTNTYGLSFIKFFNASPNFRAVFKGADSFNIYVNGEKINGSQLSYNSIFPAVANIYAAVPSGSQSIRITVNGKTTPDSITLASFNKTLETGGYYSLFLTDSALKNIDSKQLWIRDQFLVTDTNNYTIRFVDAVMNDPIAVDVYSFKKAANVFTGITPGTATPFVLMPYSLVADTFYVRQAGTMTEIARINIVNGSTTATNRGRPYTLLYKGAFGLTGTKARTLTIFPNN
jgi:hypothetical protein